MKTPFFLGILFLTISDIQSPQFVQAQSAGFGILGEVNYIKFTNDGGKGGFGTGIGAFLFFPIAKHLEMKMELYSESAWIDFRFEYSTYSTWNPYAFDDYTIVGKERIQISPFVIQLNYFPKNNQGLFLGAGYAVRAVTIKDAVSSAGTQGSFTQNKEHGFEYSHCVIADVGFKQRFARVSFRFQYSLSNVITDSHSAYGDYYSLPEQHMFVLSLKGEIDLIPIFNLIGNEISNWHI